MPRVSMCADGSLCCDDNKNCCTEGKGIFLDESGNRVAARATAATTSYPPGVNTVSSASSRPTSTSVSTPATTTTSASTTRTSSPTGTDGAGIPSSESSSSAQDSGASSSSSSSSSSGTVGLKVGLGLGIPLAVLISGALVYWFLRGRNAARPSADAGTDDSSYHRGTMARAEMQGDASYISEAPADYKPAAAYATYSGSGTSDAKSVPLSASSYPVEIGGQVANELMDERGNDNNAYMRSQQPPPPRYYELG